MTDATTQPTAAAPARAPKLTRLELHGFKSFANRTVLTFEPGITAVVGPNGSGKSNVADAVRWVLGEQGSSALRAKKTEDVIFAGGQGRSPSGLAEASLTFDNADGWLPIEFSEVTVTRRAYRGGENQYLINGRKVRLKDVQQLTAGLGQSHVVVGQGLIEAALSQRPVERRNLFEHAADLSGLRMKVAETERNLAEAEGNSARVADLLADLEPRLRTMERAARQAREYHDLRAELTALQRAHLAGLLRASAVAVETAAETGERAERGAAAARAAVETRMAAGDPARLAAAAAREAIAAHDAQARDLEDRIRRVRHERDLAFERGEALARRRQDMADTQTGLDEQAAAVEADIGKLAGDLAELGRELEAAREAAASRAREAAEARAERSRIEQAAAARTQAIAAAERERAALAQREALLRQQQESGEIERGRTAAAGQERANRIAALAGEIRAAEDAASEEQAALAELDRRLAAIAEAERSCSAALAAASAEAAAAESALSEASGRLTALRRLQESGAGLHAGVRAALEAARAGRLQGVLGTVAELASVPADYDTAIEVALGGHLQDIVTRRWADAEAAIALLKASGAGRATFQPLETVRGGRGGDASRALALAGSRGVACDLVTSDPAVRPVIESLLGRVLGVEALPDAKAALPLLPGGWSAVTLAGEIARSGGSVTGGAAVRESGVLGRERELRELPGQVGALERDLAAARAARQAREEEARALAAQRRAAESARAAGAAAAVERARQRTRLDAWVADVRRERATADARLAALDGDAAAIAGNLATLAEDRAGLDRRAAALAREAQSGAAARERAEAAAGETSRAAADEDLRVAGLEERLRAERRRAGALETRREAIDGERALRAERAAALDRERETLAVDGQRLAVEALALERGRADFAGGRADLESGVKRAERELGDLGRALEAARMDLLDRERAAGVAHLARERAEGDLAALLRRIRDDLDLEDPAALREAEPAMDAGDPAEAAAREREIARLRDRLRRIGYVGEDAVGEYERESERHGFLRSQLDDIEGAAAALKTLLADLDQTMRSRFEETFGRVAEAFTDIFTVLFGGGTARLVLVRDEDGEPGIDIVAQPPGKRLQNLALLSGGERSLTAAALLLAILRVNPSPFCILDEVDAALDEANIVRFREQLRALSGRTQAIVVTHNRGTIEIADTLYGVSMGADGVSKVLSLRLSEVPAEP
ncbi:MAG: chromosome segregation protein SMC [Chloroflexota bacterium]